MTGEQSDLSDVEKACLTAISGRVIDAFVSSGMTLAQAKLAADHTLPPSIFYLPWQRWSPELRREFILAFEKQYPKGGLLDILRRVTVIAEERPRRLDAAMADIDTTPVSAAAPPVAVNTSSRASFWIWVAIALLIGFAIGFAGRALFVG
jgi:hypothetical protein